jgi:hypothetical protein
MFGPLLPWPSLERVHPCDPSTQLGHSVRAARSVAVLGEANAGMRNRSAGSVVSAQTGLRRAQVGMSASVLVAREERVGAGGVVG